MKDDVLLKLRAQIDKLDDEIFEALHKRLQLVWQIGSHKVQQGGAIFRPEREREILERLYTKSSKFFDNRAIDAIYQEIFAISRNLELPEKVGFLGPIGNYTHQAAEERFGALSEYIPLQNTRAVFESVAHQRIKYGVIPFDSQDNGIISESINELVMSESTIIAEVVLPIHHGFLSHCEHLSDIEKIFSKDLALKQCQNFLRAHNFHHLEQIPTDSTSRAVQLACSMPKSAAIGSKIAGKIYNIPLMFDFINDVGNNKTRFVIISDTVNLPSGRDKTLIFAQPKNTKEVGDLFRLLKDFEEEKINLIKIDSHSIRVQDDYKMGFFIECEGHYSDRPLQRLFDKRTDELKWLGSYVRSGGGT